MKKIKKLFKKLDNRGSSILLVIVALTFLGVIVGALLTAAGYSYRLKMQDLNSRDNFYYVEQAMNEIYAGVGSQTVKDMQEAYTYTVENMVRYDFITNSYITLEDDVVQNMFTDRFMTNLQSNAFFSGSKTDLANALEKYITNDSVTLDKSKIGIEYGKDPVTNKVNKIIIKNVTLTRTMEYDRNIASGSYTQTISTDIEIGEPNFAVLFNTNNQEYANIFDYSMVADMGIEVIQPTTPLVVTGNVYAAADYYNKRYNESTYVIDDEGNYTVSDSSKKYNSGFTYETEDSEGNRENVSVDVYTHGSVTSKKNTKSVAFNTLYNSNAMDNASIPDGQTEVFKADYMYDGANVNSMYSGIFVDGSSLSIVGDMVIVPGTVAVMDNGSFSLYGKDGRTASEAELWADNIVLGGQSIKKEETTQDGLINTYDGSSIVLYANTYVKDDTELNANGSSFSLRGNYYGYGDSTERDERVFIPTVNNENFQFSYVQGEGENAKTVWENRGHYNSSAIIINGQKSTLDLSWTNVVYLAGRSYIELSKDVVYSEEDVTTTTSNTDGTTTENTETVISETYTYVPKDENFLTDDEDDTLFIRDYKTGESLALKTTQLAYIPVMYTGMPTPVYTDTAKQNFAGYFEAELHVALQGSTLFEKYFPESVFADYKIPTVMQEISGKKYYYYDFETAYNKIMDSMQETGKATFRALYPSAQYYASSFIVDYMTELKSETSAIKEYLVDISDFEELEFEPGDITLPSVTPNTPNAIVYSSGAITTKKGTTFNIVKSTNWTNEALGTLFDSAKYGNGNGLQTPEMMADSSRFSNAYLLSDDLEIEYDLVKWNLGHYETTGPNASKNAAEIDYIQAMVDDIDYGDASITPINKFLNAENIVDGTNIKPDLTGSDTGGGVLNLSSGYYVWVSYDDVVVKARDKDQGAVRGIVITKGDVSFDPNVTSFEGLIISGGKVYITENLAAMNANAAICQTILNECQLLGTTNAQLVLNLFKGYEVDGSSTPVASPGDANASNQAKTIDSIDYSDVCRFNNWMKNVE